jgi:ribosomal protein L9
MRNLRTFGLAIGLSALAGLATFASGCDSAQPGVTNDMGTFVAKIKGEPDKVTAAAKAALEDLQFKFVMATNSKVDGYLTAKTAQNEDVVVKINSAGVDVSKVEVKVGAFGDEGISLRIISGIQSKL